MKILLRSMIVANPATEDGDLARRNYFDFRKSGLTFLHDQHRLIFEFIRTFVESHNHVPNAQTIRQEFSRRQEDQVVDALDLVLAAKPIYRGDFILRLEQRDEERKTQQVHDILKSTADILVHGREEKLPRGETRHLKGPIDATQHFIALAHDIVAPTTGELLSGEVTRDGEAAWERYELVESDPEAGIGRFTGIEPIDVKLKGARKGQLWTHAAFTGHGKSLLARNWAYNQAVYAGASSLIFSLEMSYVGEVRESLFAMHSLHPKFLDVRLSLGIQEKPNVTVGLPLEGIVEGVLTPAQRKFYKDYVIPDFSDPRHGKIHVEVANPDKADFTVADARAAAELKYSSDPFDMIFVDHALLVAPRKRMSSMTDNINEVMRDLKKMAQAFNRGAMIPVVALYQINRAGFEHASKNGGLYHLTHLAQANEAERSSDVVTASWATDTLRKANRIQFQCLKSRSRAPFDTFMCRCEWHNGRIINEVMTPLDKDGKETAAAKAEDYLDAMEGFSL